MNTFIRFGLILFSTACAIGCSKSKEDYQLQSCYLKNEEITQPLSFTDDNWATLCAVANMGKGYFTKTYAPEGIDSLLGQNRKISLNKFGEVEATLIGIEHDNDSKDKSCLLTFQINPTESISSNYDVESNRWYKEVASKARECSLRKKCSDIYEAMPSSLKDNVISVVKKTEEYNASYKETNTTLEKVFPLAIEEYGIQEGKNKCYEAFKEKIVQLPNNVWLRSPSSAEGDKCSSLVEGEVVISNINENKLIAPAFSIGMQKETEVKLNLANCTSKIGNIIKGISGSSISVTLTPEYGYAMPSAASFSSAIFDGKYQKGEDYLGYAELTFTMPSVNSNVICNADLAIFNLVLNLKNLTSNAPTTFIATNPVKFTLVANANYRLPDSITFSSNIKDGKYDPKTGIVTFTGTKEDCSITANGRTPQTLDPTISINKSTGSVTYGSGATTEMVSYTTKTTQKWNDWVNTRTDLWCRLWRNDSTNYGGALVYGSNWSSFTVVIDLKSNGDIVSCSAPWLTVNWTIHNLCNGATNTHRYVSNQGTSGTWYYEASGVNFMSKDKGIWYYEQTRTSYNEYSFNTINWKSQITYNNRTLNLQSGQGGTNAHYLEV